MQKLSKHGKLKDNKCKFLAIIIIFHKHFFLYEQFFSKKRQNHRPLDMTAGPQ